jgi:hypothetical protein
MGLAVFGACLAQRAFKNPIQSSIVTFMLRKVADGVYWTEDADGLPAALVTALEDGTPLRVAEQWWSAGRMLVEWAASDAARAWLARYGQPG